MGSQRVGHDLSIHAQSLENFNCLTFNSILIAERTNDSENTIFVNLAIFNCLMLFLATYFTPFVTKFNRNASLRPLNMSRNNR